MSRYANKKLKEFTSSDINGNRYWEKYTPWRYYKKGMPEGDLELCVMCLYEMINPIPWDITHFDRCKEKWHNKLKSCCADEEVLLNMLKYHCIRNLPYSGEHYFTPDTIIKYVKSINKSTYVIEYIKDDGETAYITVSNGRYYSPIDCGNKIIEAIWFLKEN